MRVSPNATTLSTRVVEVVADREQVSPLALSPPLAEFVDPDALDALFEPGQGVVAFDAWGYRVTVFEDGSVSATADEESGEHSPRADR